MFDPRRRSAPWPAILSFTCISGLLAGCASPAAPKPPSLHLPEPVRDLSAVRSGDEVQLRFTVPRRTSDGQAITDTTIQGSLCRQDAPNAACRPVHLPDDSTHLQVPRAGAEPPIVLWSDALPPELHTGAPRPIAYRITLRNAEGRSAGPSEPVYTAAGAGPSPVDHFTAEGMRLGVLLRWTAVPGTGQVLLQRTQIDPKPAPATPRAAAPPPKGKRSKSRAAAPPPRTEKPSAQPGVVWLQSASENPASGATIDAQATEGVRYSYTAVRQLTAKVGGRMIELRSLPSTPVEITWRDIYAPPAPQALTALGYATAQGSPNATPASPSAGYAVDLIWQPVNDPRITGYLVSRQALGPDGTPTGSIERLTASPVTTPGFHDLTALPAKGYRYTVTATDARGNTSAAATAVVSPLSR